MVNYGGDEVSALVLDIGTSTTRAGYAGDDVPKTIFPTSYGFTSQVVPPEAEGGEEKKVARLHIGENGPSVWRSGMEVSNPCHKGLIEDWTPIPSIISHALVHSLRCQPSEHPILVTEPAWNTQANRERMAEIMFEELKVPAFYIANSGVLSAFAAGKGTALVVDIGHYNASVIPVVDGFVLRKGIAQSSLPVLLQANAHHLLTKPNNIRPSGISLLPYQLIASKMPVELNAPPRSTLRNDRVAGTTDSWKAWAEQREVEEWISSVAGVLETGWNEQLAAQRPPKHYEFPSGYSTIFGSERFLPGEIYFNHSHLAGQNPNLPKTLPELFATSLGACEPDLRSHLLQNIVLTGGGTLLAGVSDRINHELTKTFNGAKTRIHAAGNMIERRYGAWLGGSILASLGTFHQLWISAEEWQEHGRPIVAQRCK